MSIIAEIKTRRAIRDFADRDVEDEKIKILLEAATWAPNDRMREPWSFYVIKGEAKKHYEKLAVDYLHHRPENMHLVITGRSAKDEILDCADLVTEMKAVKHYYNEGIPAVKGIEF